MRHITCLAAVVLLAACGGEKVPRDYQNNPPAMTHPVTKSSDSPTAHGMPGAAPEPSKGAEGLNPTRQPTSPIRSWVSFAGNCNIRPRRPSGGVVTCRHADGATGTIWDARCGGSASTIWDARCGGSASTIWDRHADAFHDGP
jgi:hypothetical protein